MINNLQILTNNGVLELNRWIQANTENREFSKNLIVQVLETKFYDDTLPIYKCYITDSVYKLVVLILHNDKSGRIQENNIIKINRITSGSTNDSSGKIAVIKNYEILFNQSKEDELELSPSDTRIIFTEIQREQNSNENFNYANDHSRNNLIMNIKQELNSVINPRVLKEHIFLEDENSQGRFRNPEQNRKINTLKIDTINMNTINKNKLVNKFDPSLFNNFQKNSLFMNQDKNLNLNLNSDQYLKDKFNYDENFDKKNDFNYEKNNILEKNSYKISGNIGKNNNFDNYSERRINSNVCNRQIYNPDSVIENQNNSKNSKQYILELNRHNKDEEEIVDLLEDEDLENIVNIHQSTREYNNFNNFNNRNLQNNLSLFNNIDPMKNNTKFPHFINVRSDKLPLVEKVNQNNFQNIYNKNEENFENIYLENNKQNSLFNQNYNKPINKNFNLNESQTRNCNINDDYNNLVRKNNNTNSNNFNISNRQSTSIIRNNTSQLRKNINDDAFLSNLSIEKSFQNLNSLRKPDTIKNLTTLNSRIFLRVRCLYKSEKKSYQNNTKNVFNFNVIDSEGSEMPITCFDITCDKFYDMIEVNSIYEILGGYLKINDKKFTRVNSDLKLYLDESTILRKLQESCSNDCIPTQKYNFVKIEKIATLPLNKIIDLLCYVLEVKESKTIKSKKSNRDTNLKVLRVTDDTYFKIEISIWGNYANENYYPGLILAIRYVKVGEFKGRNLSVCDSASIQFEPAFSEAIEMKEKIKKYEGEFKELPHFINEIYGLENNGMKIINIGDLVYYLNTLNVENITLGDCVVKGTVVQMIHSDKNYYPGCPVCKKKLSIDDNNFCIKCKQNYEKYFNYFHINLLIKDDTGELGLDILGENAENILGIKCDEYKDMFENNSDDKLFELSNNLEFQTFYFTIIPRIVMFENKINKRYTCVKFTKIEKDDAARLREIENENYNLNRLTEDNETSNRIINNSRINYKSFISRVYVNDDNIKSQNQYLENEDENLIIDIQENTSRLSRDY